MYDFSFAVIIDNLGQLLANRDLKMCQKGGNSQILLCIFKLENKLVELMGASPKPYERSSKGRERFNAFPQLLRRQYSHCIDM